MCKVIFAQATTNESSSSSMSYCYCAASVSNKLMILKKIKVIDALHIR